MKRIIRKSIYIILFILSIVVCPCVIFVIMDCNYAKKHDIAQLDKRQITKEEFIERNTPFDFEKWQGLRIYAKMGTSYVIVVYNTSFEGGKKQFLAVPHIDSDFISVKYPDSTNKNLIELPDINMLGIKFPELAKYNLADNIVWMIENGIVDLYFCDSYLFIQRRDYSLKYVYSTGKWIDY